MEKFRFWEENSKRSESKYFNWEILDDELLEEFEFEVGYTSDYSVRLSNHNRPPVVNGFATYEHRYFYDTRYEENFEIAKQYLMKIVAQYCNKEIDVEQFADLLSDQNQMREMKTYLGMEVY